MAIVVYKCNVCNRTKEITRFTKGLDTTINCNITQGCRGKLYQSDIFIDYIRGSFPPDVPGLDNWQPRRVLYNHIQSIERQTWTITHNLSTFPVVQVLVNRPIVGDEDHTEEIIPTNISIVDKDTVDVLFDQPWSGTAQLIARQTNPNILDSTLIEPNLINQTNSSQISSNGEITIATKISTLANEAVSNIELLFVTPSNSNRLVTYAADNQPALDSAWSDTNLVIINNTTYSVRSFNAIISDITTGIIGNGSTFKFLNIDPLGNNTFQPIKAQEVLVLLSDSPHSIFDKQTDTFIDVFDSSTAFEFFYDSGEFHGNNTILSTVYPHIRSS